MPVTLIIAIILAPFAIGFYAARWTRAARDNDAPVGVIAAVITAIALVLIVVDSATIVPTKTVGVVTSFGRPVSTLTNGLHWVAPWHKVTRFDGSIQTDSHVGRNGCTTVRLANQATACADNSIRWRIQPHAAGSLYQDYRDFDAVRDSLVTRELTAALNDAFSSFDPLTAAAPSRDGTGPLSRVAAAVTAHMRRTIGAQVKVLSVVIPVVRYDDSTQDKINQLQAELANTRIAEQREKTAAAEARANRVLASSVSHDPNVLVSKCLDWLAAMQKARLTVPAGFTCWPSDGKPVVVGGK